MEDVSAAAYARLARQVDLKLLTLLERADLFALGAQGHGVDGMTPCPGGAAHIASRVPGSLGLRALTFGRGVQAFEAGIIHTPDEAVARSHDARAGVPELVATSALSGSGTTSSITEHVQEHEVISLDALRAELGGDAGLQQLNG